MRAMTKQEIEATIDRLDEKEKAIIREAIHNNNLLLGSNPNGKEIIKQIRIRRVVSGDPEWIPETLKKQA